MTPLTKTYVSLVFVALALFEFWSAMRLFGRDPKGERPAAGPLFMRLHRIGGYVFLVFALYLAWIGLDMLLRFMSVGGYDFTPRKFSHALLAFVLLFVVLLKIAIARFYRKYRAYIPLLGIIAVGLTLVIWAVAGLMYLFILGRPSVVA